MSFSSDPKEFEASCRQRRVAGLALLVCALAMLLLIVEASTGLWS